MRHSKPHHNTLAALFFDPYVWTRKVIGNLPVAVPHTSLVHYTNLHFIFCLLSAIAALYRTPFTFTVSTLFHFPFGTVTYLRQQYCYSYSAVGDICCLVVSLGSPVLGDDNASFTASPEKVRPASQSAAALMSWWKVLSQWVFSGCDDTLFYAGR